jgi:dTDP-4-amino-4,6-dideoxygalactose transaminase
MRWKYSLSEPTLGSEEESALRECLKSGWLSMGSQTIAFEEEFAKFSGCRHAIAVSSGTAALHLAMLGLGIGSDPADEVIQPSINFVAGANMTMAAGAKPVFADIISLVEPTIDPAEVETLIGPHTKAVMVMHYGGYSARIREILALCRKRQISLIEDACHAPGWEAKDLGGRSLGTIGDVGCFSFFANKNMTTGEGGMVVTDSDALATRMRNMRSHGMTTLSWQRHIGRPSTYDVVANGFNYRLDDIRAALGLAQLRKLPEINERRRALAGAYAAAIDRVGGGKMQYVFGFCPREGSAHLAAVVVAPEQRDRLRDVLSEHGIQSSLHYPPVHKFTAFKDMPSRELQKTTTFSSSVITLPLYPALSEAAVDEIVDVLAKSI